MPDEHAFLRTGDNLLEWLEACRNSAENIRDSAYALVKYGAGEAPAVDVQARVRLLLKAADDYNRRACGILPHRRGAAAAGAGIDLDELAALARRAAAGDGAAAKRLIWIAHEAERGHRRARGLLAEAELPKVAEALGRAASVKLTPEELEALLGVKTGGWR